MRLILNLIKNIIMVNHILLDTLQRALKKQGLKFTSQRIAVFEEIINHSGHRECEDIYLSLKKKSKQVSRATVYRTMEILIKNDFARKMDIENSGSLYESKINNPHHDHLICTSCSKILEFIDEEIERLQIEIAKKNNFIINRHIHQLFGICKQCQ